MNLGFFWVVNLDFDLPYMEHMFFLSMDSFGLSNMTGKELAKRLAIRLVSEHGENTILCFLTSGAASEFFFLLALTIRLGSYPPNCSDKLEEPIFFQWVGFREKSTGNHRFSH